MFDIGFSEVFVIAIVALIVLGPERLPKAARFAGLWVRRARAQWYSVKSELERELADEDLKRSLRQAQDELRSAQQQLRDSGQILREGAQDLNQRVAAAGTAAAAADAQAAAAQDEHAAPADAPPAEP
ncbi:Sec-independent protein translocase protein TatB, partial [Lysobacter enzymogenes]|uniref:Sec-independent protein translocase protein TatB n=1 Tax=Lysobacter enzymogenes TaxID=69 RepID=UPI0019D169F7